MKKHTLEENQEKKVTLLQKVSYLFDRKQKRQIAGLALLILIGGLLETVGVSMLLPVVQRSWIRNSLWRMNWWVR